MAVRVAVVADSREWPSGVPKALVSLGVKVCRERLAVGDYDVGGGILVERKSVRDLHLAIVGEWSEVRGLGPRRTLALWEALHDGSPS